MAQAATVHLRMVLPPDPWTRAISERKVSLPGVTWECNTEMENAPDRFVASAGLDVGENGVRRLVLDRLRGAPPTAIPVFLGREHMQRNILVRADSPLQHPRDLAGKRVASWLTPHSGTGAAVMMMLEHAYEVPVTEIEWLMGDPASLPTNRMGLRLHRGPDSVQGTLDMLRRGEVDAIMVTLRPRHWSLFGPDVVHLTHTDYSEMRPLIEDPATIAEAFRKTGLYPISDLMVVSPEIAAHNSQLPRQLVEVFAEANGLAPEYMDPEERTLADREEELLGRDAHQYGLTPDARHNLAAFIDYLYRLGSFDQRLEPEDLLIPGSY
jgi:4,5-dihydroxyphthalate decarboxylase